MLLSDPQEAASRDFAIRSVVFQRNGVAPVARARASAEAKRLRKAARRLGEAAKPPISPTPTSTPAVSQ